MEAKPPETTRDAYRIRLPDVWTCFAEGTTSGFIGVGTMSSRKCVGFDPDRNRFQSCGKTTDRMPECFNGGGRPVLNSYLTHCKDVLKDGTTINNILCEKCRDRCERMLARARVPAPKSRATPV